MKLRATVESTFPTPEIVVTPDRVESYFVRAAGEPQISTAGADEKSLILQVSGAEPGLLATAVKIKAREVDYAEDRIPLILDEYRVRPKPRPPSRGCRVRARGRCSLDASPRLPCVHNCSGAAAAQQPIDGTLEFIAHGSGGEHFQLLSGGGPLGNYAVDLVDAEGKRQHLTSDANGMVHLPGSAKGR